jgi:hypothetical protein
VRPDATPHPEPAPLSPAGAAARLLRELADVREVDLAEGLGPRRLAALSRLAEQAPAGGARRRRRLLKAVLAAALALGALAAVLLAWR